MSGGSDGVPVSAFYRACNAGDAARAAVLYAQDGWHRENSDGRRREGRAALEAGLERFFAMLPGAHVFEMRDGAIAGTTDYWNPAVSRRQIGGTGS